MRGTVLDASRDASWVVCCVALPPGVPDDFYAALVREAHAAGLQVAVDSSGSPMAQALSATPDLIKPNRIELAEAVGRELGTVGAVVEAARGFIASGVGTVVVSLGRDGALLVDADQVVHAAATISRPLSTVGAGDSLLAGYLHGVHAGDEPLRLWPEPSRSRRCGDASGSEMPGPVQVAAVQVTLDRAPDASRPLAD